jgi:hypothetical protein
MRAIILSVFALSALALSACETQSGYKKQLAQFQGNQADTLLREMGQPSKVNYLKDGREVWIYESEKQLRRGGYFDHVYFRKSGKFDTEDGKTQTRKFVDSRKVWVPHYTIKSVCKTHFVIQENDVVGEFNFRGNGCLASEWGI